MPRKKLRRKDVGRLRPTSTKRMRRLMRRAGRRCGPGLPVHVIRDHDDHFDGGAAVSHVRFGSG